MVNQNVGLILDWELSLQGVGIGVHLSIVLLPVIADKKKVSNFTRKNANKPTNNMQCYGCQT